MGNRYCVPEFHLEHLGQRRMVEQVWLLTLTLFGTPESPLPVNGASRHHEMYMRMQIKAA